MWKSVGLGIYLFLSPPFDNGAPLSSGQLLEFSVPSAMGDDILPVEKQKLRDRGLDGQTVVALESTVLDLKHLGLLSHPTVKVDQKWSI